MKKFEKFGFRKYKKVYHNLSFDELYEHEKKNEEGQCTDNGTFAVDTGILREEVLKISIL